MATANSTSITRAPKGETPTQVPVTATTLENMASRLHDYAALLAGIEDICRSAEVGADAHYMAGKVAAQINSNLCSMADQLNRIAEGNPRSITDILDTHRAGESGDTAIAGAKACLAAIRQARRIVAEGRQYHSERDAAKAVILRAAGPVSPRAAGALALLADLVIGGLQDGYGVADFLDQIEESTWQPEATMTNVEVAAARASFDTRVAEDRA